MKNIYSHLLMLLAITFILGLNACKKPVSKQAQYLPKDASYVLGINGGTIKEKLKDEAFSLGNLMSTITGSDSVINSIKEKLNAVKNSGIDLEAPIYMAFQMKSDNKNDFNVILTAAMKNATDFEEFLKKQIKNVSIQKAEDISYIDPSNGLKTNGDDGILGWNKDAVIFTIASKNHSSYDYDMPDTANVSRPPSKDNPNTATNNTLDRLKKIFNQKEDESLLSISEFKSLQQEKSDATLWLNTTSAIAKMPMKLPKMKSLLENSYMAATINFNDGEVVLDGKSYLSKELGEIYKKYAGPTIDLNLLEKYPSNNLNGFVMVSFKPAIISEIMKTLGIDGLINIGLIEAGLTLDDVIKLFKGDVMAAFSDFGMKQIQSPYDPSYTYTRPDAKWLVSIPFGDKTAVDKIMNALIQKQKIRKEGNKYIPVEMPTNNRIAMNIDDKGIIIASDSILMQQYIAGASKATIPSDVQSTVKGKALALYVDIDKMLTAVPASTNDMQKMILDKSKALFKDVIITGDNYDDTCIKHRWALRLKDQKENSLKQLYKYAQALIEIGMKAWMVYYQPDDRPVPPVMPSPIDSTTVKESTLK